MTGRYPPQTRHPGPNDRAFLPVGALAQTFPRAGSPVANVGGLSSGRLHLTAIDLPLGLPVTSITFMAGATPLSGGTNQWFALYSNTLALLGQTADDTSTAWAAYARKTLALASPVTTTYSGLHYLGLLVAASTPPSLAACTILSQSHDFETKLNGSSTTGLTTTAPNPAGAMTVQATYPWAYVS